MEERIVSSDPVADPAGYTQELIGILGGLDPIEVLAATPAYYRDASADLTDEQRAAAPAPGEWSVEQLLGHLLGAEIVYSFRWRLTLAQDGVAYPGYDQDEWTKLVQPPFTESLDGFSALRAMNVTLLRGTPRSDWSKSGIHSERGPESFELSVNLLAGHDLAHLKQLDQTIAAVL
ncbi:MAG TPA: DinB family protein [Actinomycetota bacterium]|nr:DinB family protein [Actinomycetota bacterium]